MSIADMEILPGIHRFDTQPFNWYLIEDGGRPTLVDAGLPALRANKVNPLVALRRE